MILTVNLFVAFVCRKKKSFEIIFEGTGKYCLYSTFWGLGMMQPTKAFFFIRANDMNRIFFVVSVLILLVAVEALLVFVVVIQQL